MRSDIKKKKNVKSPEIQCENLLYRLNELRILQRPLCCYWSVSCIVLQSDHTFCFYFCLLYSLIESYLLKQSCTYYSVGENC